MNILNKNMLMKAALWVLFLGTASTDGVNKTRKVKPLPSNCVEAVSFAGTGAKSGIYQIRLPLEGWTHRPFYVYCLLDRNGGDPWLLVQRRQNDSIDFYRTWNDYTTGFGNLATSFWIGLEKLNALTQVQLHELQIELHDFKDTVKYANYEKFAIGDDNEQYAIDILDSYSGSAGDSLLGIHDGEKFSTYDVDNDKWNGNCADDLKSGWWFSQCHQSNLNGEYLNGTNKDNDGRGIIWDSWHGEHYSLKYAHMAIRPRA